MAIHHDHAQALAVEEVVGLGHGSKAELLVCKRKAQCLASLMTQGLLQDDKGALLFRVRGDSLSFSRLRPRLGKTSHKG